MTAGFRVFADLGEERIGLGILLGLKQVTPCSELVASGLGALSDRKGALGRAAFERAGARGVAERESSLRQEVPGFGVLPRPGFVERGCGHNQRATRFGTGRGPERFQLAEESRLGRVSLRARDLGTALRQANPHAQGGFRPVVKLRAFDRFQGVGERILAEQDLDLRLDRLRSRAGPGWLSRPR